MLVWLTLLAVPAFGEGAAAYDRPPPGGIIGTLTSVGSDTLANLMTLWSEGFKRDHPGVNIQIQGSGSSTAPPALIEGTATFGPMSRRMNGREIEAFQRRYGYAPTAVPVAIDALAVYVHQDNPIQSLTLSQVDAVFSATRRCGAEREIRHWGELGLEGSWVHRNIQLFGRNSVSGTYGYFKEDALCGGDFRSSVNEQPGSASVVQAVSVSLNGMGYSGIGYRTASVRPVAIAPDVGEPPVAATQEEALSGAYPLTRFLYIYVNKAPTGALPVLEREFLRWILSPQGQSIVAKDGYMPLPKALAIEIAAGLGLE